MDLDDVQTVIDANREGRPSPVAVAEDDPALLVFTSGTTGRPKAVVTSHRGVCGATQINDFSESIAMTVMGAEVARAGSSLPVRDDIVLVTAPLFHTSMLYGFVLRAVSRGLEGVLLRGRFEPERVLEVIERERVTSWLALGSAAPRVCASPERDRYDTSSLSHIGVGGAPVSPAVQQAIRETFPNLNYSLSIGYASTESVAMIANLGGFELVEHPTSTGRIPATTAVELRDAEGNVVAEGELGEVHVRTPYRMLGYWNDPAASDAVLKEGGWLAMGDLGRMVDGLLYIDTRARDMILVSAENVSPTEVEYRLDDHPDVVEAAVFAIDDDQTGDAVCAVIVTDPSSSVTAGELATWCRTTLAHYKVPTTWYLVHEPLPRTASGKLIKGDIRQRSTSPTPPRIWPKA
jgi:acyl-CoA synthetase (AMP-forming)/AMP-acid ligase II